MGAEGPIDVAAAIERLYVPGDPLRVGVLSRARDRRIAEQDLPDAVQAVALGVWQRLGDADVRSWAAVWQAVEWSLNTFARREIAWERKHPCGLGEDILESPSVAIDMEPASPEDVLEASGGTLEPNGVHWVYTHKSKRHYVEGATREAAALAALKIAAKKAKRKKK